MRTPDYIDGYNDGYLAAKRVFEEKLKNLVADVKEMHPTRLVTTATTTQPPHL